MSNDLARQLHLAGSAEECPSNIPSPAVIFANPTIMLFSRGHQPVAVGTWWREAVTSASGMGRGMVNRAVVVTIYCFVAIWVSVSLSVSCMKARTSYS